MTTFKPTHKLDSGHLAELEHEFEGRVYDGRYGLFYMVDGSSLVHPMSNATALPKMIQVSSYEEPEPLRAAPEVGMGYWVITCDTDSGTYIRRWEGNKLDRRILAQGKAYATQEDALAADAARQKARGFA